MAFGANSTANEEFIVFRASDIRCSFFLDLQRKTPLENPREEHPKSTKANQELRQAKKKTRSVLSEIPNLSCSKDHGGSKEQQGLPYLCQSRLCDFGTERRRWRDLGSGPFSRVPIVAFCFWGSS